MKNPEEKQLILSALAKGMASVDQLNAAMMQVDANPTATLVDVLLERRVLTPEQLIRLTRDKPREAGSALEPAGDRECSAPARIPPRTRATEEGRPGTYLSNQARNDANSGAVSSAPGTNGSAAPGAAAVSGVPRADE